MGNLDKSFGEMGKVTDRDGSFIAYANGVVCHENMGLEWYAGPDKDTSVKEVESWVENLTVDGGGWRMPTQEEIESLYEEGAGKRNMTPLLKTTGWIICSGEAKSSSMTYVFNFHKGRISLWSSAGASDGLRGFAVRSHKSLATDKCEFCGKSFQEGEGKGVVVMPVSFDQVDPFSSIQQAAEAMLASKYVCADCGSVFCLECGNVEGSNRGTGKTHCPKCGSVA